MRFLCSDGGDAAVVEAEGPGVTDCSAVDATAAGAVAMGAGATFPDGGAVGLIGETPDPGGGFVVERPCCFAGIGLSVIKS
jgi:hypothetical protein